MRRILCERADGPQRVEALARAGSGATKRFALELLRENGTGDRFTVAISTDSQVGSANLRMLTAVQEHAELPVAPEVIERLERSVA
jgi:hypothetical protein